METKFSMEFTVKEWDSIINGLEKVEEQASQLKNTIVTGVNSQIAQINQAANQVQTETVVESDTTNKEDKIEGENK